MNKAKLTALFVIRQEGHTKTLNVLKEILGDDLIIEMLKEKRFIHVVEGAKKKPYLQLSALGEHIIDSFSQIADLIT